MESVVETREGRLAGVERRDVHLFRGIRYARPPVGELRFRAPQPPEAWGGVQAADDVGPAASQPAAPVVGWARRLVGTRGSRTSEDCLRLNVWTPGCDDARRPVMVWLHGGAFLFGSGATPIYAGGTLARRGDVVVVTINYRLGALGYLHLTELLGHEGPAASNCGLRDQIAALEWVQANIEAFGGDPHNVTVFGESAGAMSVGALLGSPRARRLFHRAILQSGACHNVATSHRATGVAECFLNELGLHPTHDDAATLQDLPVGALLDAQRRTLGKLGFTTGGLPFQPAVDGDVLPCTPLDAIAKGDAAGIPILVGTNRDEWKLFTLAERGARRLDEDALVTRIAKLLPGQDGDGRRRAQRALEVYRRAQLGRGQLSPFEMWVAFQSDRIFRYPATRLTELQAPHEERTWSYLFTWAPPLLRDRLGACHGIELPFVFGTLKHPALRPLGLAGGTELARDIQSAWLAFAHTGDPSSEGTGAWEPYNGEDRATMVLGRRCFIEHAPLEAERAFWEGRLAAC